MALRINIPPISGGVMDYDGWYADQYSRMKSFAPALTNFIPIKPGLSEHGVTLATADDNDGLMVGGGVANAAGAWKAFSNSVFQTPKTTSWGFAMRAILQVPTVAKFNLIGVADATGADFVGVASYHTLDTTNFLLYANDGASETTVTTNTASDGAIHTFTMVFNGTTQYVLIDGSLKATNTTITNVTDQAMYLGLFGTDAGAVKAARICYGYIAP